MLLIVAGLCPHTVEAGINFKDEIWPILEAKCVKCHQAPHTENGKTVKPKSDLRLDAAWAILKGGESNRPAVVAKDPVKSHAFEVVNLPKDDDMFMPPKGDPLTEAEIAKFKKWIEEGADFGGWEGNLTGKPANAPGAKPEAPRVREHDTLYTSLSQGLAAATPEVLKQLSSAGAQVNPIGTGSPLLRVDFLTGVSQCTDEKVLSLLVAKEQITQVDLARTVITDASLKTLASLPRLTRLDLRKTAVTDEGLKSLTVCKNLNSLNLYGTGITDGAVDSLSKIKSLQSVFLFESKLTDAGVARLKAALPNAEIVSSVALPEPPARGEENGRRNRNN